MENFKSGPVRAFSALSVYCMYLCASSDSPDPSCYRVVSSSVPALKPHHSAPSFLIHAWVFLQFDSISACDQSGCSCTTINIAVDRCHTPCDKTSNLFSIDGVLQLIPLEVILPSAVPVILHRCLILYTLRN